MVKQEYIFTSPVKYQATIFVLFFLSSIESEP